MSSHPDAADQAKTEATALRAFIAVVLLALLATVAGLAVAIPTYVAYNYLTSQVDTLVYDMERSATDLVNLLSSKRETYEV